MTSPTRKTTSTYTCNEYRDEMILAALQKQLQKKDLSAAERKRLEEEITRLENSMGL